MQVNDRSFRKNIIKDYKKLRATKTYTFPYVAIIRCLGQLGHINEQKEYRKKLADLEDDGDPLNA